MAYKLENIVSVLEEFAPLSVQAVWDNSGLVVGEKAQRITKILVALDLNEEVVKEAIEKTVELIVVHHPPIFGTLKCFDETDPRSRALLAAIKRDIAVYAAHTSVDFTEGGLNDTVAELLGLVEIGTVSGEPSDPRIGKLITPMTLSSYAKYVQNTLGDPSVDIIGNPEKVIETAAVINGAGGGDTEVIKTAFLNGADVFLTAEVKYHVARFTKDNNYAIISFGHYESERVFSKLMKEVLSKLPALEVLESERLICPYQR